ncbi:MAG: YcfL family protein [Deltaproteobacteria bacterium]
MKLSPRMLITILLAFILFPVTACQTAPPVPEERTVSLEEFFSPPSDKVSNNADNIVVRGVRTKVTKGVMKADFKLYNNRGRRNVINYRVQWLDKDGMMASPYDAWVTIDLEGQQEMIVTAVSPTNKAVDYRLELKTN